MFGSQILEVAMGMIFIFLLVSVVCSAVREGIEALLKTRAAYLENGIRKLLHDTPATGLAKSIYGHPLIEGLFPGKFSSDSTSNRSFLARGGDLPSYIPSKNFAVALMDLAARGQNIDDANGAPSSPVVSLESIRANIQNLGNPAVQRVMLTAIDSAQGDLNKAQAAIEAWYNSGMDRISGLYKRKTQWIIFWLGLALAVGLNVNSLTLVHHLYINAGDRAALTRLGDSVAKKDVVPTAEEAKALLTAPAAQGLDQLPIGWAGRVLPPHDWNGTWTSGIFNEWIVLIFGWLITAFAASMGAPFWFDMLNKVSVIRSTVKPHEKSPEEPSKDQPAPATVPAATEQPAEVSGAPASPPVSPTAPTPPTGDFPSLGDSSDPESSIDGCDVEIKDLTKDEDLPAAEGGVEK